MSTIETFRVPLNRVWYFDGVSGIETMIANLGLPINTYIG
jgi:hypothetical protein